VPLYISEARLTKLADHGVVRIIKRTGVTVELEARHSGGDGLKVHAGAGQGTLEDRIEPPKLFPRHGIGCPISRTLFVRDVGNDRGLMANFRPSLKLRVSMRDRLRRMPTVPHLPTKACGDTGHTRDFVTTQEYQWKSCDRTSRLAKASG
jgi:hypothetical protein